MKLFKSSYKKESDAQLMIKVGTGDTHAFEELYERYSGAMMAYFYKMLWQDREKAEDFVQDLFMKLIKKPELYDSKRSFKTWLYSIANNMCKNEYRKQEVRKGTKNSLDEGLQVSGNDTSFDRSMDVSAFNQALDEALNDLEEKHRTVFIMRFKLNLSIKEIAESIDISEGTVKSRIFYCLKKLNAGLQEYNPVHNEKMYG